MKTAEEYLTEHIFRHYRNTFDSDERAMEVVKLSQVFREEHQAVIDAMEECASEAIREKEEETKRFKELCQSMQQTNESICKRMLEQSRELAAKDKEIEQLREALATVTKEQLQATVKAQLSGNPEQFTGPVVGVEDEQKVKTP